jgi:hypothetical protein
MIFVASSEAFTFSVASGLVFISSNLLQDASSKTASEQPNIDFINILFIIISF